MGPIAILKRFPLLRRRVLQTVDAAVAMRPDALVILDSPEFTHAVAKRVRRALPDLPVIDYVSPSIWAWRPGRARRMRAYVDHVLAILPFEPEAHRRLGGPDCTYVGHPLIEKLDWIKSLKSETLRKRLGIPPDHRVLTVLPGSRVTEIGRMMPVYRETVARLVESVGPMAVVIPIAEGSESSVRQHLSGWPVKPHLVHGDEDKFMAFRLADAALATSGTVTLELALAGTPMVVAYKVEPIVGLFIPTLKAHSIVLPNLVLGENVFPEFLQKRASPSALSDALAPLLDKQSPELESQRKGLAGIERRMRLTAGTPSQKAAVIVLRLSDR